MSGYLSGLSSPSVTERIDHFVRLAQVEAGGTDQIADVLDQQQAVVVQPSCCMRLSHHVGIQMTALAGIDLQRGCAGGADARGIVVGLLVALDHGERQACRSAR